MGYTGLGIVVLGVGLILSKYCFWALIVAELQYCLLVPFVAENIDQGIPQ